MKQLLIISFLLLPTLFPAAAQSGYDAVLQQIETNSPTLAALREQRKAQQLDRRTGIYLANPEVELNYLWGSPHGIGNRTDFSVRQAFDFPTVYGHRNKMADLQNTGDEQIYQSERLNVLLAARQLCIDLVYYNALNKAYAQRLQNAETLAAAYQARLERGDANRLEYNKAQLNLTTVSAEKTRIEAEQAALLAELRRMNGNQPLAFATDAYPDQSLPVDFEDWYASVAARHPTLQYADSRIEIGRRQVKLNRALGLPAFSAGYMSERVVGERFQGLTLGVSIPLRENKNRVKQAQAQVRAAESMQIDAQTQLLTHFQNLYLQAAARQKNAQELRVSLTENDNEPLLQKALDRGEISLLNYLLEMEYYYEAVNKKLEAERAYARAVAELMVVGG